TQHEFVVITIYYQAIRVPYMREICGPLQSETNMLKLGPLHEKVKSHLHKIIADPDLLLSPDMSYETGSLDGKLWEMPEAIYAVLQCKPQLPHLSPLLVSFCTGALETWE
ncbi:hypothetical protein ARMGADRAFT_871674, partial [Armillaria gallica]